MSEPFEPARSFGDDRPTAMSPFVPILVLALVMLAWFGFQATLLRAERDALREAMTDAAQVKRGADAKKLMESLDAIMRGTSQLADGGNPNARLIVDELKKHGVSYTPTKPASAVVAPEPTKP